MTNITDARPVHTVSDQNDTALQPVSGKLDGGQILTERDSTQLVNSMKGGSASSFLSEMEFSNGQAPNQPREMPSWIEMHNNVSQGPKFDAPKPAPEGNSIPTDGSGSKGESGPVRGDQGVSSRPQHGSKSMNENIHLAAAQIIVDEELPEDGRKANSKPEYPVDSKSPEPFDGPGAPREIQSEDPSQHPRKTTPEEFKKEIDKLNLSPEATEIAHDLTDAFGKGKLKDIVDALSGVVKEHSKDPEAMKEAVGGFNWVLRKYGFSDPMSVTNEGGLVFGGGAITIQPDGKVVVKPVQKAS